MDASQTFWYGIPGDFASLPWFGINSPVLLDPHGRKGVTAETLPILMKPLPPELLQELMNDILTKRNQHLLGMIREWLPQAQTIIVPWGAAHMTGIAREIEKLGFHQVGSRDYTAIGFGS